MVYWGALNCLYGTLSGTDAVILEKAISAYQRGYFESAERSIRDHFTAWQTNPVIAFALSDLYDTQGRQLDRAETLREALEHYEAWPDPVGNDNEGVLFRILRADAQARCSGALRTNYDNVLSIREKFLQTALEVENVSQVEAWCVIGYRKVLRVCNSVSNWTHRQSHEFLCISSREVQEELLYISRLFEEREDLVTAMQLQLMYIRLLEETQRPSQIAYLDKLCEQLLSHEEPAGMHYALSSWLSIMEDLQSDLLSTGRLNNCEDALERLKKLDHDSPRAAFQIRFLRHALECRDDTKNRALGFLLLAEEAHMLGLHNDEYIAVTRAVECLFDSFQKDLNSPELANLFEKTIERSLQICTDIHPCALLQGLALGISTKYWTMEGRMADLVVNINKFWAEYPSSEIPTVNYTFSLIESTTARHQGEPKKAEVLQRKAQRWLQQCNFVEPSSRKFILGRALGNGSLLSQAIISYDGRETLNNVVDMLLSWSDDEVLRDQKVDVKLSEILYGQSHPLMTESSAEELAISTAAERIFGTPQLPTKEDEWTLKSSVIEQWLRHGCQKQTVWDRHYLLEKLYSSRVFSLRQKIITGSETQDSYVNLSNAIREHLRIFQTIDEGAKGLYPDLVTQKLLFDDVVALCSAQCLGAEKPLVTDKVIRDAVDILGKELCDHYEATGQRMLLYVTLCDRALLLSKRYGLFASVEPDSGIDLLERADFIYCDLQREATSRQLQKHLGAADFKARLQMGEVLNHQGSVYVTALLISLLGLMRAGNLGNNDMTIQKKRVLEQWIERTKSRTFLNAMGVIAMIPARLFQQENVSRAYEVMLETELRLIAALERTNSIPQQIKIQTLLHRHLARVRRNPDLKEIMAIRDGECASPGQIQAFVNQCSSDIVVVTYVQIVRRNHPEQDLWMVVYRTRQEPSVRWVPTPLKYVQSWIAEYLHRPLAQAKAREFEVLNTWDEERALHRLDGLVQPLEGITKAGQIIVFCLWQALHRLPMHALELEGEIMISRNPVVYCPSLSILRRCKETVDGEAAKSQQILSPKAAILCPLNDNHRYGTTYTPLEQLTGCEAICDTSIPEDQALDAIDDATLLHYHGHVSFSERQEPLQQRLELDYYNQKSSASFITAETLFSRALHPGALAVLVGCQSGRAQINNANDLLGLPTALIYAGATGVISTLWKIDIADARLFVDFFYHNLMEMSKRTKRRELGKGVVPLLNIAVALQLTVKQMMTYNPFCAPGTEARPFHWASFMLTGYWETIETFFKVPESPASITEGSKSSGRRSNLFERLKERISQ